MDLALQPAGKTGWLVKLLGGDKVVHCAAFTVGEIVWVKSIETIGPFGPLGRDGSGNSHRFSRWSGN